VHVYFSYRSTEETATLVNYNFAISLLGKSLLLVYLQTVQIFKQHVYCEINLHKQCSHNQTMIPQCGLHDVVLVA
jgi:hypothetical protein